MKMKKWLSLWGSIGIFVTVGATVTACGTSSTPKFKRDINKLIIQKDLGWIRNKDGKVTTAQIIAQLNANIEAKDFFNFRNIKIQRLESPNDNVQIAKVTGQENLTGETEIFFQTKATDKKWLLENIGNAEFALEDNVNKDRAQSIATLENYLAEALQVEKDTQATQNEVNTIARTLGIATGDFQYETQTMTDKLTYLIQKAEKALKDNENASNDKKVPESVRILLENQVAQAKQLLANPKLTQNAVTAMNQDLMATLELFPN